MQKMRKKSVVKIRRENPSRNYATEMTLPILQTFYTETYSELEDEVKSTNFRMSKMIIKYTKLKDFCNKVF